MLDRLADECARLRVAVRPLVRTASDADDVLQETCVQALRSLGRFRGDCSVRTWLYRIAVRAARRRQRGDGRRGRHEATLAALLPIDHPRVAEIDLEGPVADAMRSESLEQLAGRIARLPRKFRLALVLKDIAQLEAAEVAAVLGLRLATVKSRVLRARLSLRRELVHGQPGVALPPPLYDRLVCMDLLRGKMDALDRGVPFPVQDSLACERCRKVFEALDLGAELCRRISGSELDSSLRERVRRLLASTRD